MNVHSYVLNNWKRTIRNPENKEDSKLALLKMPYIYTTPCADEMFKNFYYWDTYFTNLGLLEDDLVDVARCNVKTMSFLVTKLGFVPNADHLFFGTQPPFFARSIYDLYKKTLDINDIKDNIDNLLTELKFWDNDRMTSIGLNQYKCGFSNTKCIDSYSYFIDRVSGLTESEKAIDKVDLIRGYFAIAESGWDVNSRYERENNRFASLDFINLDLNCILYDAELKASYMLEKINRIDEAKIYAKKAKDRKELINKYCLNKQTNIYFDYCFVDNTFSKHLSAASLYPYAFGISEDKVSFKKVLDRLMLPCGLSVGEKDKNGLYFQWEYPNMWPPVMYIAYIGAKRLGLDKEANLIKNSYMSTVEKAFEKTGALWEKYDSTDGSVTVNPEYKTPEMLGWTAGVYEYLRNN